MPRGRPPKSIRLHLIEGTYRADRHARRRVAQMPGNSPEPTGFPPQLRLPRPLQSVETAEPGDGLTPGQAALLRLRPKGLPWHHARHYRELVVGAPWLEPIDRPLLLAYIYAADAHQIAGRELDRRLRDPAFADPRSDVAREGLAYSRLEHRKANLMLTLSRALGFSPAGRRAIGVEQDIEYTLDQIPEGAPAGRG